MRLLDAHFARELLVHEGLLQPGEALEVRPLGGGVSNVVLYAQSPRAAWVLKQARPRLAVADEWLADVSRAWTEAECLKLLADWLPGASPRVVFEARAAYVFAIEGAPLGTPTWKDALMAGRFDPAVARSVGALLGTLHTAAAQRPDLAQAFDTLEAFAQLRLDPYRRTVARRHPEWHAAIDEELQCLNDRRWSLVHGDYSPKNLLLMPGGAAESPRLWLLDCEVAHWGHPAFDVAFMLNHLLLKAIYWVFERGDAGAARAALALAPHFWRAYVQATPAGWQAEIEARTAAELPILLLARVDGKSPVEYLKGEPVREKVRCLARELRTQPRHLEPRLEYAAQCILREV
ncbi:MAG TPA: aminoglycoside phosphotransferase family protein [Limnochordia bacterium]|nr:aminoglycoside phosphotransferase family protein [Limnochordia bacterium]